MYYINCRILARQLLSVVTEMLNYMESCISGIVYKHPVISLSVKVHTGTLTIWTISRPVV